MDFCNDFARNVIAFGTDNSSSSHTDNRKNIFLMLGEGPTDHINGSAGAAKQKFSTNFNKAKMKFSLSFHYNGDNSYLVVDGKKSISLQPVLKNVNFPTQFYFGSISEISDYADSEEVTFKGNVDDFLVDYDAIDKTEILNIHKYLIIKKIKIMFAFIKKMFTALLSVWMTRSFGGSVPSNSDRHIKCVSLSNQPC